MFSAWIAQELAVLYAHGGSAALVCATWRAYLMRIELPTRPYHNKE